MREETVLHDMTGMSSMHEPGLMMARLLYHGERIRCQSSRQQVPSCARGTPAIEGLATPQRIEHRCLAPFLEALVGEQPVIAASVNSLPSPGPAAQHTHGRRLLRAVLRRTQVGVALDALLRRDRHHRNGVPCLVSA